MSAADAVPAQQGFRMPAEWQQHEATWVAWPHNRETWPRNLEAAQHEFVRLVETIGKGESVCLIASGEALQQARQRLSHLATVEFFDVPTNDAWIRDYGPTFVVNRRTRRLAAVTWRYNGWGEKYPPFDADAQAAARIADASGCDRVFSTDYVVEGGAIEINDAGDLITTISCLLNFNRNPIPGATSTAETLDAGRFDQYQNTFSQMLAAFTGASSVNWLSGAALAGDDTDGHIDQQLRFASDRLVLVARGCRPDDPQDVELQQNLQEIRRTFAAQDKSLQGLDLPLPFPIELHGERLPASYLNFYICNYGVIVPQFDDTLADIRALEVLRAAFPHRRVIGLPSLNLACGLGSFHCLTQQQPAVETGS